MAAKPTPEKSRPTSFYLSVETRTLISDLADYHHMTQTALVEYALRELDKRRKDGGA